MEGFEIRHTIHSLFISFDSSLSSLPFSFNYRCCFPYHNFVRSVSAMTGRDLFPRWNYTSSLRNVNVLRIACNTGRGNLQNAEHRTPNAEPHGKFACRAFIDELISIGKRTSNVN